jgi:hypothetical protein
MRAAHVAFAHRHRLDVVLEEEDGHTEQRPFQSLKG